MDFVTGKAARGRVTNYEWVLSVRARVRALTPLQLDTLTNERSLDSSIRRDS